MLGTIARIKEKGFGFIKPDDGSPDLFFHASNLHDVRFDELREGDAVEFEIGEGKKGPAATEIRRA